MSPSTSTIAVPEEDRNESYADGPPAVDSPSPSNRVYPLDPRIQFAGVLLLAYFTGLILRSDMALDTMEKVTYGYAGGCGNDATTMEAQRQCLKDQPAYRLAFASATFFLVHLVISNKHVIPNTSTRIAMNTKWPALRAVVFVLWCAAMLLAPVNPWMFDGLVASAFMGLSVVYFIVQQVNIFIAFAKDLTEIDKERRPIALFLGRTALLLLVGTFLAVLLSTYSGLGTPVYAVAIPLLAINFVLAVVHLLLGRYLEGGSPLLCGLVFVYSMLLCYGIYATGILAGVCHPTVVLTANVIVASVTLAINCSTRTSSDNKDEEGVQEEDKADSLATHGKGTPHHLPPSFHAMMLLGACYMAMLLTSWHIADMDGSRPHNKECVAPSTNMVLGVRLGCGLLFIVLCVWK